MVAKGWSEKNIEDLLEFHDSKRIPLSSKERSIRKGVYRYYGAQGVIDYINDYIFDGEYILLAEDGENLKSRKQPVAFKVFGKFWVNNHAHILVARKGVSTNTFLLYLLNELNLDPYITGAAQPKLSQSSLRKIKASIPPIEVQQKIAGVLSAYDDLIENNNRRIKILEEIAQRLYKEWFLDFRFPGHENTPFTNSELGRIPAGWEVKKLGDCTEFLYGKALKEENRIAGDYPVYGSSGVVGYHNQALVNEPGIIVGRKGNVGSVFRSKSPFYVIDTAYYVKSPLPKNYLYRCLRSMNFLNNDAAVPGLNRNQAYSLKAIVPPLSVLEQYEEFSEQNYSFCNLLNSKNDNLRTTRDLLLPRLISGELSVENLEVKI